MPIELLDNGVRTENGEFLYLWYHLKDRLGRPYYRAASIKELYVITDEPGSVKNTEGTLGKQWGSVRGLYNAGVNFIYTACGIYKPNHIGIMQYYGAAADGETEEQAATKAINDSRAVEASLAGYAQSKLRAPDLDTLRWYINFVLTSRNPLAIIGHPDPRVKRHASGSDGHMPEEDNDLSLEQNEILFRGMSKLRINFIFQVLSEHVPKSLITQYMTQVSRITSNFASRKQGSKNVSFSLGLPIFNALSQSYSNQASQSVSKAVGQGEGLSSGWGNSHTNSYSHTNSVSDTVGESHSETIGGSTGHNYGQTNSTGTAHSTGTTHTVSDGTTKSTTDSSSKGSSSGTSSGWNVLFWSGGANSSSSSSSSHSSSTGTSHSVSDGTSESNSTSSGVANTLGNSTGAMWASTDGVFSSHSVGSADSKGFADGASQNWGQSHSTSESLAQTSGMGGGASVGGGVTYGLSPSVSIGQSWQTEDALAVRLTEIMYNLSGLINSASVEGGFVTNAFIFTDSEADASAAATLIPEAFHGSGVPTPVMTVKPDEGDKEDLAHYAASFVPYIKPSGDPNDPFDDWLYYRYATFLPTPKVAAYTAPGMIQEGTLKIIPPIPDGVGFYPNMKGEVILGHQFSPSTAELTNTPVMIDTDRLMHTMFAGNTGFGKSVAAMRMVYEMSIHWGLRIVVMDFGFAWRQLLNAPGLEGRVDIRQLRPDGVRPLRWNPLQIGRYINAETQIKAFVDIFGTVAQLGQRQQSHRMMDAVRTVYLTSGVLVDDPEVRKDAQWGKLSAKEAVLVGKVSGTFLRELTPEQRQMISVHRSKSVGLKDLNSTIQSNIDALKSNDQLGRQVLEGIIWRLKGLTTGSVGEQFAADSPDNETQPIEELGRGANPGDPGGVVVLEGGKFLDNFSKAWLLGWAGWMIYSDMVARRERQLNLGEANLFMVFEEANIIFSGLEGSGDAEGGKSGPSVSEQYSNMFRDSRKYGSYFGVITQSPSLIPAGIRSSCNNMVIGFLTDPKDKDVVLSALARSEKGFHDEPWRRFISDEGIGMVLGRFPYAFARELQMPFLFQPLILNVSEPSDAEIAAKLGRITLRGI